MFPLELSLPLHLYITHENTMKTNGVIISILGILVVGGLVYWGLQRKQATPNSQAVQVVASFYPLAEFARHVGGNLVQVQTVVPAGSEPHDYEPTPQDVVGVHNASVFIYNGGGVDSWADKIAPELMQKGVRVINISDHVSHLANPSIEGKAAEEPEGPFDPHFWLDPVLAQEQVKVISEALIAVDPEHAVTYTAQSEAYIAQLQSLDQEYQSGLASCVRRDIVTSHAAFGYLAKRYNLTPINISGISPEEEPAPRTLSEIAQIAKQKNIKYIFFETLVSPKLAQTIALEIGAKTIAFNPLEGITDEERQAGKDYLSLMRDNLQSLRIAMECR